MIYLDNPATSYQKPPSVIAAISNYSKKYSVNAGRGAHTASIAGAEGISHTQEKLAAFFNIDNPDRIAFTLNATYALNMAIKGLLKPGDHAVITSMEHNSVLRPVASVCDYTMVTADSEGRINPQNIEYAITDRTRLIVTTHASNVAGSIMPVREIGEIAKKYNIPYLLDAAQSAGIIPIDVKEMNLSMLAFSGHKGLLGPLGVGGLYVREDIELSPIITGGTGSFSKSIEQPKQFPDMLHSGTMNTPAIMALWHGVDFIERQGVENILNHEKALANQFIREALNISGVTVYGPTDGIRNGTVLFNIKNIPSEQTADILNRHYGIAVRGGYHCAYTAHETLGSELHGGVRAGFGVFSTKADVNKLTDSINKIAHYGI